MSQKNLTLFSYAIKLLSNRKFYFAFCILFAISFGAALLSTAQRDIVFMGLVFLYAALMSPFLLPLINILGGRSLARKMNKLEQYNY